MISACKCDKIQRILERDPRTTEDVVEAYTDIFLLFFSGEADKVSDGLKRKA